MPLRGCCDQLDSKSVEIDLDPELYLVYSLGPMILF